MIGAVLSFSVLFIGKLILFILRSKYEFIPSLINCLFDLRSDLDGEKSDDQSECDTGKYVAREMKIKIHSGIKQQDPCWNQTECKLRMVVDQDQGEDRHRHRVSGRERRVRRILYEKHDLGTEPARTGTVYKMLDKDLADQKSGEHAAGDHQTVFSCLLYDQKNGGITDEHERIAQRCIEREEAVPERGACHRLKKIKDIKIDVLYCGKHITVLPG